MSTDTTPPGPSIIHPDEFARDYPHETWTWLRKNDPVHWWDRTEGVPFWALTTRADIVQVSKQPTRFTNNPRWGVRHKPDGDQADELEVTLINMDPPRHGLWRKLVSKRFTPAAIERFRPEVERIGEEIVDRLFRRDNAGDCDFVKEVAAPLPIAVIAWMLGWPRSDWEKLFDWTNRIVGAGDPEFRSEGKSAAETMREAQREIVAYLTDLVAEKRRNPRDDLITLLTQARVDGQPLETSEVLSWCFLIMLGGNETTRNATTGGIAAFADNPDQLARVRREPELVKPAVEEVLRWTSPVIHMARTAQEPSRLRDKDVAPGDTLVMFYPSANRDEEVFDEPFSFRVDRAPNPHLAFGVGEHFCLGAHLARLEMQVAFKHLLPRLAELELAGSPERLRANQVGGIKHLPIRYRLRSA
ncbi:MAG: cytochrome P450 [Myxococcales bacterium]|nr:cytochrome P450 [Myxococcales bacterium]